MYRAQGTLEYLLIIGVVVVISLVVVGLLTNQLNSADSFSQSTNKVTTLTQTIALTESAIEPNDGNYILKLLNNTGTNVTITNVKVGDTNILFSQDLAQGTTKLFRISSSTNCPTGTTTSENVTITYTTPNGLTKTENYSKKITFECTPYTITETNLSTPVPTPNAPTNITAIPGDTATTITFTPPENITAAPTTGYTINISPSEGTDLNAGTLATTHTITGLSNSTEYTITVTATNAVGNSSPSTSTTVTPIAGIRHWVGLDGDSWSSDGVWALYAGGPGEASTPNSSSTAYFTSLNNNDCNIDTSITLTGLNIGNNYSGTVRQNTTRTITLTTNGFIQTSGTFSGGDSTITTTTFTEIGGAFTATSDTLTVSGDFNHSGGNFTNNSGTMTFSGNATNIITNGITFNTINFTSSSTHSTKTLFGDFNVDGNLFVLVPSYRCDIATSSTSTIYLNGNFSLGSYNETFGKSGTINLIINGDSNQNLNMGPSTSFKANLTIDKNGGVAKLASNFIINSPGSLTINADNIFDTSSDGGTTNFSLTGTGPLTNNGTFYGRTGTLGFGNLTNNATFTSTTGTLTVTGDFNNTTGTFTVGEGTVTFSGNATNIITNGITFNTINFTSSSAHSTKTLFGDFNVDGNLFVLVPSYRCDIATSSTSTIYLNGNFSLGSYNETFGKSGTINLIINGDSNQNLNMGPSTSFKANLTLDKPSGQALLGSNFTVTTPGVTTINADNTFNLMGYTLTNYSLINNGTIIE